MAKVKTIDFPVEGGATVHGTKYNDVFHITSTTGNATIIAGNKGTDTLYFDSEIESVRPNIMAGSKDLHINYTLNGSSEHCTIIIKDYFTSTKATDSKSSLKNIRYTKNGKEYKLSLINDIYFSNNNPAGTRYVLKNNVLTGTKFGDYMNEFGDDDDTGYIINSGKGSDYVLGSLGNDTINTSVGNDDLFGNGGNDILKGGKGINTYHFRTNYHGDDTIKLTKGETVNIKLENNTNASNIIYKLDNKNNAKIYFDKTNENTTTAELIGFAAKDITKAANIIFNDGSETNLKTDIQWEKTISKNYNGSYLSEKIDASGVNGTLKKTIGKGKSKQTVDKTSDDAGLKINGGLGNDEITATIYSDKITGGKGTNIINVTTQEKFGNDEVVLTKGENLVIRLSDSNYLGNHYSIDKEGNNLKINIYKGVFSDIQGTITVKNYFKKDVITSSGSFIITNNNDSEFFDVREFANIVKMDSENYKKQSYKGTWVDDDINANSYTAKDKKGNVITTNTEKTKGVNVNLGNAVYRNNFRGSIYADTVKGGNNGDYVIASAGNDTYTLGKGENYVRYSKTFWETETPSNYNTDTINLTKGENLIIHLTDFDFADEEEFLNNAKLKVSGKNLLLTLKKDDTSDYGTIVLKNFAKSDVVGANGSVKVLLQYETTEGAGDEVYVDLKTALITSDKGTWHNDFIDKSGYEIKKKGAVVTDVTKKGLAINGGAGADEIIGSNYSDTIKAGTGTGDIIEGGTGNDKLYASTTKGSNTTFNFKAGDGKDIVYSGKGEDTLNFENISLSDITLERVKNKKGKDTNDLKITYTDNDSVTIKDYYKVDKKKNSTNTIKHIKTNEGVLDLSNIIFGKGEITGNENDNIIVASSESDTINASEGNNTIYSNGGNDTITVGNGNNTIYTKSGNDNITLGNGENNIYIGVGEKTITTGTGVTNIIYKPENVGSTENFGTHTINYTKDSTLMLDLRGLNISSTGVSSYSIVNNGDLKIETVRGNIIISGYDDEAMESEAGGVFVHFAGDVYTTNLNTITSVNVGLDAFVNGEYTGNKLGEIINASGLETPTDNISKGVTINAGAGNDNIRGTNFDDTINGEAGADTIVLLSGEDVVSGGAGNDTISVSGNSGNKYIDGGAGDDKISGCQNVNYTDTLIGGAGKDEIYGYSGNDIIYGDYTLEDDSNQTTGDDDKLYGGEGSDIIYGGGGSDIITSKAQPSNYDKYDNTEGTIDELHGGAGDDFIYGQSKKNIMYGDEGNDYIEGRNEGEDIFRFKKGDGVDTIKGGDDSTVDTIEFYDSVDNIDLNSLTPAFNGNDLEISYSDTDKIIIKDYIKDGQINSSIDTIKFADGTTKSIKTDLEYEISATSGSTITGTVLSDYISGSNEADTIYAGIGDDFIIPNKGDDIIYGGSGANTYYINPDSGINTIYSTSAQDIIHINYVGLNSMAFAVEGDDVVITNDYDSTKVIVKDYLNSLHNITIKDNSNYTSTIIEKLEAAGIIVGSGEIEGDDNPNRIIGSPETDTITGKGGADIMNGAGGADTYIIRNNDGHDAILSGTDGVDDIINFTDSKFEDLIFTTSNDEKDVVITHNSGNDSVTLKNFFEEGNTNTTIIDSDEEEFNILNNAVHYMVGEGDGATLTGTSLRDNITGTDGDDTITAGKNNDTIITGKGHDTLNFSNGDGHDTVIISDDNTQTDFNFSSTTIISCGFEVSGNDVIVKYNKDTNNNYLDSITVKDYLLDKNENKVHDRSYGYDLLLDNYVNNVITNQSGTITGTRLKDTIYDSNSDDIIHAGKGDDIITVSNAGNDYIYGEAGDDEITATQSTGNKYIDGGDGDDNIFGCNKAEYSDTIVGGLGTDNIYGSNGNDIIYGDYTLEQDATQTTGVNDNLNGGLGSDTIYGGGGNDQIQGYGNFWGGSSGKDTSTGIVDRLYGGAGNDSLYGASETTYMDGGSGNDTYYMFIDQNNIISDTEGTNDIVIYNTANTTDNYYTNLHIVFNVSKNGVLDENGLRVLNTGNYNTWQNNCNDENITGVKVVSGVNTFNSIQTAYSSGGGHKVTNISELISSVASWLTSGGRNYDDVSAALASSDKDTLITYIAEQTNWQNP